MKFLLKLKIKGCDKIFKEGMEPGVLVEYRVEYPQAPPYKISMALFEARKILIEETIEVEITGL